MIVAFFDFDHTITTKDSFLDFITYVKGRRALYTAMLRFVLPSIGYKLGLVSGATIKERYLTYFFKDLPISQFKEWGTSYAKEQLPNIIHPKALARIKWHQSQGHEIVVVTASIDYWIVEWTNSMKLELIATQLEQNQALLTGRLDGGNCNGQEKVKRISAKYNFENIEDSYGYGNSGGDKPMLSLVNHRFYKYF